MAGGAFGVVLDSQLSLLAECQLPAGIKADIRAMDGSETRLLGGYVVYSRPGLPVAELGEITATEARRLLAAEETEVGGGILPIGQDAALAKALATQCANLEALLNTLRMSVVGHLHQACALDILGAASPLAEAHGTRYPIAQGPLP